MLETVCFKKMDAKWVWHEEVKELNSYVRFIHEFDVEDTGDVDLLISADTDYIAYVNGQLVGYGQYDDYPFHKVFDRYDIRELLSMGKNRLCILGYYQGVESFQYYKSEAGLIFTVNSGDKLLAASGSDTKSCICPSYVSGPMESISPQLAFTFKYSAIENDRWLEGDFSLEGFKYSMIVDKELDLYERPVKKLVTKERVESRLCAQGVFVRKDEGYEIGQLMLRDYLSARRVFEISNVQVNEIKLPSKQPFTINYPEVQEDGVYLVFDLGREEVGLLDLDLDAGEGTIIEIGYGEHLDDLRVRSHTGGRNFACRYVCGKGRQQFTHYLKRVGCRYIQLNITNIREDISIYYAGILPVNYPLCYKQPDIRDRLHKKIYEVAVRTLELCMHEHYEDCPWREQALYTMDSRNQALCGYYCFEEYDFPESCLRLFALNINYGDGMLELCAPAKVPITIPSFTFLWVLELYEFWKHSRRSEFIKEMFPVLKQICDSAAARIDNGLFPCYQETRYWNFYEWADGLDGAPIFREYELDKRYDAPLSMFLIIALECAAEMASAIGEVQMEEDWLTYVHLLRTMVRNAFYDKESGLYYTYGNREKVWHLAELTQALAVYSKCSCEEEAAHLRKVLADKNNGLVPTTLSYMAFKYDALLMDADKYGVWVFDDIADIWGNMLFKGATSFWETQAGACDFDNAGSLCHGWSAIPVYYYHKYNYQLR